MRLRVVLVQMINSTFRFVVRKNYLKLPSDVIDLELNVFALQVLLMRKRPESRWRSNIEKPVTYDAYELL